ncbi:MAG: homoserine dehydrogenase, partial [Lachnospiraceae bacterium]|nr:homoserine dehydrogenase [Lachnospiraceae bacterium]
KGYAELHPEADVEGYDACRKIAILTSLAFGKQLDFEDIHTEGITNITAEDFRYAQKMNKSIKLLGKSWTNDGKLYAMVCPMLLDNSHPLAGVKDVFNAIFVHGNMVDDVMFYGKGAGSLPTASAVVADVIDCARNIGNHLPIIWEEEKLSLDDFGSFERKYFVRVPADTSEEAIKKVFGTVEMISVEDIDEKAFVTGIMNEKEYHSAADSLGTVINMIRFN